MNPVSIPADIQVFRVRMPIPPDMSIDLLLEALAIIDYPIGSWEQIDTGEAWIEAFGIDEREMQSIASQIADVAESIDGNIHYASVDTLAREDWTESWKKYFHILHITDNITVCPLWEEHEKKEDEIVVLIEPGMSFGTGIHQTTQSCIKLLEELALSNKENLDSKVLDFGCGSGILSITAKKLGFRDVEGYDYDPAAVKSSKENAEHNNMELLFDELDVTAPKPLPIGDIVVANILAVVLIDAAESISKSVSSKQNSTLILSGILEKQYDEVKSVYEKLGFIETTNILAGEWKSGMFKRK